MTKKTHLPRLFIFIVTLLVSTTSALAQRELFPLPSAIKNNVEFWKKVYAVYPSNKVLIHDTDDLSIIYEVIDLYTPGVDDQLSYREQWRKVEDVKRAYRLVLLNMASGKIDPARASERERRALEIFGREHDGARIRRAAYNVRGQQGLRDRFLLGLQRSGLYRDAIAAIFLEHGLPEELIMLPHVESSFNYQAYSKLGAAGMWQFTRSTGRLYLTINYDVDDRLDPIRSTAAAAKLLKHNYDVLRSWPLAITAYNHGPNGMKRAKALHGGDFNEIYNEYRSRTFGFASKNFYAEFLAALDVATNHQKYFGRVDFHAPTEFVTFENQSYMTVNTLLETFNMDRDEFREFNPALRPPVLNSQRRIPRGYPIRLPKKPGVDMYAAYASIDPHLKYTDQVKSEFYQVRRGDNLASIARRFGVSQNRLVEYNNLSSAQRIYAGEVLKIPPTDAQLLASTESLARSATAKKAEPIQMTSSTTMAIAEAPVVSDASPPEAAIDLVESERILTLDLPVPQPVVKEEKRPPVIVEETAEELPIESEWLLVEAEETLGHYATWLEVPTQRLREINGLRYAQEIQIGQRIRLTFQRVSAREFYHRRLEYRRSIEEDFFTTFKVDTTQVHTVARGQNIWMICNDIYQLPMWLIVKYNSDRDLTRLNMGDQLVIPVVSPANPDAMVNSAPTPVDQQ
jgi:membrane-bound lytic murein transglycosylase D